MNQNLPESAALRAMQAMPGAMKRALALTCALAAGCVLAQAKPPVTDVGPPPAENRDSAGAIVLDHARVPARRAADADPAAAAHSMGNAGSTAAGAADTSKASRDAERAQILQRMREDLASQREAEARALRQGGAGSLISR